MHFVKQKDRTQTVIFGSLDNMISRDHPVRIIDAIISNIVRSNPEKFEYKGRAPKCTLVVFIDDATSKVVWLHFAKGESTESLMTATRRYLETHGRPLSIYVDFGGVFSVNTNNPERDKLTQFGRAMKELDIKVKYAHSPQAKGRVERANGILQDRLVKEMRLAKINSIEDANSFVQEKYLPEHNEKFSVRPELQQDLHRSIDGFDLDRILCYKNKRILQKDFVVSYENRLLQLQKEQKTIIRPKDEIVVHETLDGKISLHLRKVQLFFSEISVRPTKSSNHKPKATSPVFRKPPDNHPWKIHPARKQLHKLGRSSI